MPARKSRKRTVGTDDARVGLQNRKGSRAKAKRESAFHLCAIQPLPRNAAGVQCRPLNFLQVGNEFDQPMPLEQLLPCFDFKLAPARERLLCQTNPLGSE